MVALEMVDAAIEAIGAANPEEFKTLLEAEPLLASERDRQGVSLLMQAIYRQQHSIVALLLERGATIDAFAAAALGDAPALRSKLAATPGLTGEFSPDGLQLLGSGWSTEVRVWNLADPNAPPRRLAHPAGGIDVMRQRIGRHVGDEGLGAEEHRFRHRQQPIGKLDRTDRPTAAETRCGMGLGDR